MLVQARRIRLQKFIDSYEIPSGQCRFLCGERRSRLKRDHGEATTPAVSCLHEPFNLDKLGLAYQIFIMNENSYICKKE